MRKEKNEIGLPVFISRLFFPLVTDNAAGTALALPPQQNSFQDLNFINVIFC